MSINELEALRDELNEMIRVEFEAAMEATIRQNEALLEQMAATRPEVEP